MPPHKATAHRRQQAHEGKGMLALLALAVFVTGAAALDVDHADGGYTGVSVSIHRDVPYSETIVENIKSLFRSSSEFLHQATNGRVFFKQVTINFPHTWPKRPKAQPSRAGLFDTSDVRVDVAGNSSGSDVYADQPFTKQIMRCGRPGDFIQVTPTFLLELNASTTQRFGKPAYAFVHAWAHFRYGVFDEHGYLHDDTYPITYCHEGKVKLNSCSSKITFTARTPSGKKCEIDSSCRVLSKDCVFGFYQNAEKSVESSVMFMPYVDNVSQFCKGAKTGSREHNPLAPNKQNAICKGRSSWEVISSNSDFKDLPTPDLSKRIRVTFKETQESDDVPKRVVMLLDVSNSMDTQNRMQLLKDALSRYVIDSAEGSQQLAVVTFAGVTSVAHPLTTLNNRTRAGFLKTIQKLRALDSTCIGCGLKEALKVLGNQLRAREGGIITLVSDGEETSRPSVADVLPDVLKSKTIVNTVAIGEEADPNLEMLAGITKGKAYFFQDGQGNMVLDLQDAFRDAAATAEDAARLPVLLVDAQTSFSGNLKLDFFVDDGAGRSPVVYIHTKQPNVANTLYVWLADPTGSHCTSACPSRITGPDIAIKLPDLAMPGKWSLHLSTHVDNNLDVNIQVKSRVRNETVTPVLVTSKVANLIVNHPEEAIVYAELSKGKKVVLDAAVSARVMGPNSTHSVLFPLRDDGKDPDNHADDGTYSGYVTRFTGRGRYAVTALVSSQNGTRLADRKLGSGEFFNAAALNSSKTGDRNDVPSSEYSLDYFVVSNASQAGNPRGEPVVLHFQRVVSGGSFQVNMTKKTTPTKPEKIKDLLVFCNKPAVSGGRPLLQVSWSWKGKQTDPFERFRVIIRASLDHGKLMTDFKNQTPINKTDIVDGSLEVPPMKAKYSITASMPAEIFAQLQSNPTKTVYFGARILSIGGLRSDVSKIASVSCQLPRLPAAVTTTDGTTTTPFDMSEPTTVRMNKTDTTPASQIYTSALTLHDTSSDAERGTDTTTPVVSTPTSTSDSYEDVTTQVTVPSVASTGVKTTEEASPSGTTAHNVITSTAGIRTSTEAISAKVEATTEAETTEQTNPLGFSAHNIPTSTAGIRTSTEAISAKIEATTEVKATEQTPPFVTTSNNVITSTAGFRTSTEAISAKIEATTEVETTKQTSPRAFTAHNIPTSTAGIRTSTEAISAKIEATTEVKATEQTAPSVTTSNNVITSTAGFRTSTEAISAKTEATTTVGTLAAYNETTPAEAVATTAESTFPSSVDQTTTDVTETSTGNQAATSDLSTTEGTSLDGVTDDKAVVSNVRQQRTTLGGLSIWMYALIGGVAAVMVFAVIVVMVIRRRRSDEDYIVMFTKSGHDETAA